MHLGYHLYYTHLIEAVLTILGTLNSAHLPLFTRPKISSYAQKELTGCIRMQITTRKTVTFLSEHD